LRLDLTRVSGTNYTDLGKVHSLRTLFLPAGTTDTALGQLAGLTQLKTLAVRDSAITNDGLRHLAGWKHLWDLYLNDARIGDQGLKHLAGLVKTESLNLVGTRTTDKGLSHLEQLHKQRKLYVRSTSVTLSGVVKFFTEIQSRPLVDALDAFDAVGRNDASEIVSINVATRQFGRQRRKCLFHDQRIALLKSNAVSLFSSISGRINHPLSLRNA